MTHTIPLQNTSKITLMFVLFVLVLISLYIFQFLNLNTKTFAISKIQSSIAQVSQTNKELEIQISKQGLISQINQLAQESNFEKINHIDYLKIGPESVAQK